MQQETCIKVLIGRGDASRGEWLAVLVFGAELAHEFDQPTGWAVEISAYMKNKTAWHPRNRHQGHYDFEKLVRSSPELARFLKKSPRNEPTIDFSDPQAVRGLNRSLLKLYYGVSSWDIPPGYLCPPVPGRADYLHYMADLLASRNGGVIPRGGALRVLDVGVGANCIYPIVGHCEYGWHFVGTDIDSDALASAKLIVKANRKLSNAIEFRMQTDPGNVLSGILESQDAFALSICNPPFHASLKEARAGNQRKRRNLGLEPTAPRLNFGGKGTELWCPGGEGAFARRMIEESREFQIRCLWFSILISKESTLAGMYLALKKVEAREVSTIDMSQGQKKTRIVAWTFFDRKQQGEWLR
jgi:23S rRNA (adenine1618-N6)-methyltransferase